MTGKNFDDMFSRFDSEPNRDRSNRDKRTAIAQANAMNCITRAKNTYS